MNKWNLKIKTQYYILASPRMKYLDIHLKNTRFEENCNTLMSEIKEELNKWGAIPHYAQKDSMLSRC